MDTCNAQHPNNLIKDKATDYEEELINQAIRLSLEQPTTNEEINNNKTANKKKKKNKCASCNKKLGLVPFDCRCGKMFCSKHRHAEQHDCDFDFAAYGKDILNKANPKVTAEKITKI